MDIREGMLTWPSDPQFETRSWKKINDHGCNVSYIRRMGVHTGTHIDAPKHFIENGEGVDGVPLDSLCGKCKVLDFSNGLVMPNEALYNTIYAQQLIHRDIEKDDIILLKTRNSYDSMEEFNKNYACIAIDAAQRLVSKRVRAVGIDYLSIAPFEDGEPVHRMLLENDVAIIEGLRLKDVPEGEYMLYCLPLKIVGSDGAPARAILVSEDV